MVSGSVRMAKTTYKQTTKGDKFGADLLARAAKQQRLLAKNELSKLSGFTKQRDASSTQIANKLAADIGIIQSSFDAAGDNYAKLGKDNDAAEADNSFSNMANMRRERAQSLDQVRQQGGGETDLLKSQGVALRNWNANQQDTQRNFADTLTSINNNISELNQTTRSNIHNTSNESDAQQRQNFNEWKSATGEAYGSALDMYGSEASLLSQARSAAGTQVAKTSSSGTKNVKVTQTQSFANGGKSKAYGKGQTTAEKDMLKMSKNLVSLNNDTYKGSAATPEDLGFSALQKQEQRQNMTDKANAQTLTAMQGPQGATLREW